MHTYTTTYATLEISESSFKDIKKRLELAGVLDEYWKDKYDGEIIIFGTVGLIIDKSKLEQ